MCPATDGIEDTEHYLLLCQSYEESRRELFNGFNKTLPSSDRTVEKGVEGVNSPGLGPRRDP